MAKEVRSLELAAAALARRDLPAAELRARLERGGVAATEAAAAVERLAAAGYVDDARFGAGRAESLAARGYGDAAIANDLERRGIGRELVAQAVAALAPEAERAAALLERWGHVPKAARRLVAKGFGAEAVAAALGERADL